MSLPVDVFTSDNFGTVPGTATGNLAPGDYVGVVQSDGTTTTDLSNYIVFGNGGHVNSIQLVHTLGLSYEVQVNAAGPSGWDNAGYLCFYYDDGSQSASLSVYVTSTETHIVTFSTTDSPNITKISWSN